MTGESLRAAIARLASDPARRRDIEAIVARHGAAMGDGELDDASLDRVSAGGGVTALAADIRAYLTSHPLATDSSESVATWWSSPGKR